MFKTNDIVWSAIDKAYGQIISVYPSDTTVRYDVSYGAKRVGFHGFRMHQHHQIVHGSAFSTEVPRNITIETYEKGIWYHIEPCDLPLEDAVRYAQRISNQHVNPTDPRYYRVRSLRDNGYITMYINEEPNGN